MILNYRQVAVLIFSFILIPDIMAMGGNKSIFEGEPTERECRLCHGDNTNLPHPSLQIVNANRHHSLVGKSIEGFYNGQHDSVAPGDTSSGDYECLTCHVFEYSQESQQNEIKLTTDCLSCHPAWSVTGNPHMGTNVHHAKRRRCHTCHGFLSSGSSSYGGMSGGGMRGRR